MGKIADRVKESTSTVGTGTYTTSNTADAGFRTFASAFSNADTVEYAVTDGTDWEVGEGVLDTAAHTITRGTIRSSSNANAAVNWGVGTRTIWSDASAYRVANADTAPLSGITGLGTNVATLLGAFSSANLAAALTTKTGTGNNVFSDSPAFTTQISTPAIKTASGALTVTPAAGSGMTVSLSGAGKFQCNVFTVNQPSNCVQINSSVTSADINIGVNGLYSTGIFFPDRTGRPAYVLNSVGSNFGYIQNINSTTWGLGYGTSAASVQPNSIAWNDSGQTMLGNTSPVTIENSNRAQIAGTSAATNSLGISAWSADALGARLELGKSRGAAIGTNTIVQSGDVVGTVTGYGANGSAFTNSAQISMEIDGTPGATNDMPGRIVFKTTPDGSGTLTEAMRLSQDQTALFASSVKTAAPTTGTAAFWKLGSLITGQVGLVMNTTQYVEIDIGGTFIKVATI